MEEVQDDLERGTGGTNGEIITESHRFTSNHYPISAARRYRVRRLVRINANRRRRSILSTAFHAAYFSFNAILIGLIQVKYQNRPDSPFETHPILMLISVIALCIYGSTVPLKMAIQAKYHKYESPILGALILFSGLLSPLSLASLFLPK